MPALPGLLQFEEQRGLEESHLGTERLDWQSFAQHWLPFPIAIVCKLFVSGPRWAPLDGCIEEVDVFGMEAVTPRPQWECQLET